MVLKATVASTTGVAGVCYERAQRRSAQDNGTFEEGPNAGGGAHRDLVSDRGHGQTGGVTALTRASSCARMTSLRHVVVSFGPPSPPRRGIGHGRNSWGITAVGLITRTTQFIRGRGQLTGSDHWTILHLGDLVEEIRHERHSWGIDDDDMLTPTRYPPLTQQPARPTAHTAHSQHCRHTALPPG